jgi:CubicO group peptidase (beta-lactamase class C family)
MYNPLQRIARERIAPTEIDYFRHQSYKDMFMIWELQCGIGGHAGIFSNSMDVAKIMQLYLQKNYGNRQYFSKKHSMTLIPVILLKAIEE